MSLPRTQDATQRRALRRCEVRDQYGASLYVIDAAIRRGHIRTKHYGTCVFLDPADCERLFGFGAGVEISSETLDELGDLLA